MKQGLFVVIEGISGSGKDTQLWNVARHFYNLSQFENVLVTREPSDTEAGRKARAQREADKKAGIDTRVHAALYAQLYTDDTIEHCTNLIGPALKQGVHVVCGRYKHSRFTYQVYQGVPLERIREMNSDPRIITPDLTLILDLPVEVALGRIDASGRPRSGMEKPDIMEDLRKRYLTLPDILKGEYVELVDANQPPGKVFDEGKLHLTAAMQRAYQKPEGR